MTDNSRKHWDQDGAKTYLQYADLMVVERKRIVSILKKLFALHFPQKSGLTMLDLGCGDGFVTKEIRSEYRDNTYCLMDGSGFMIESAREGLRGHGLIFLTETFEAYLDRPSDPRKYDFVYSVNAIHHLDSSDKRRLFCRVLEQLKPGGLFLNSDPVAPSSSQSEKWQFHLWTDWMHEAARERGLAVEPELIEGVPFEYKRKPENKPSGLMEQILMLQETGFRDVDCFYKYGIFALFGGTKPV